MNRQEEYTETTFEYDNQGNIVKKVELTGIRTIEEEIKK